MRFQLPINIPSLPEPIRYTDKILLIGSCFTEHMASRLESHKFQTLQNPHGILFNPLSVAKSLLSYASEKQYSEKELFYLNELWSSWDHHTRFSHIDKQEALAGINAAQREASSFIKKADWIIITLGSAFQYFLTDAAQAGTISKNTASHHVTPFRGQGVSNNHRAPAAWFEKRLLEIPAIINTMNEVLGLISQLNPSVRYLFTISPVRHVRDGVVDNNRSKARLIEAVHQLCDTHPDCHYFPAYELVMDVLRDYRFYDIDLVHPNYAATESVWEAFVPSCIAAEAVPVMQQVKEIVTARSHRPRFPETEGHRKFMQAYSDKVAALSATHPYLDLREEADYFNAS